MTGEQMATAGRGVGRRPGAALPVVRGLYGTALLIAPVRGRRRRWFCRALGVRQVAEAAMLARHGRSAARVGAAVDAVHAASALLLARRARAQRRALQANAAVAGGLAAAGLVHGFGR